MRMTSIQIIRYLASLGLVVLFSLHVLGFFPITLLEEMENLAYDARLRLTMPEKLDSRVVIVDLDEKSLAEVGRWPWSRDKLATMIDTLFDHYQIGVLGFDVVFAEPDTSSGLSLLEQWAKGPLKNDTRFQIQLESSRPSLRYDRLFADSIEERAVILGYYFKNKTDAKKKGNLSGTLPNPIITLKELGQDGIPFVKTSGFGANLTMLQFAALGGGFFDNPLVDRDGIFRKVPLLQEYNGGLYQSLSFGVVRALLGDPPLTLGINNAISGSNKMESGLEWVGLGRHQIPVDEQGAVLVPFRGRQGMFPYISAIDVLERRLNTTHKWGPETLKGAIVLVGTTAPGLMDLRSTPVGHVYPGVEIHANIISGMLDGTIKKQPTYVIGLDLFLLFLIGGVMTFLMPRLTPISSAYFTLLLFLVLMWSNIYFWLKADLVLPVANTTSLTFLLFVVHMSFGFFVESRGKRRLSHLFGQYIPKELVAEMSTTGQEYKIGGDSRIMTVLFADIRGFTKISEGLAANELTHLMNAFLTPMTHIIHKNRGTIDKYMGDAIMAFWDAPMEDPDHAQNGLLAAMSMIETMNHLKDEFQTRGWPALKIGIGINTGMMSVGNMGSEFRMAYTVMGDSVNLASRLEGLTKQYGVSIIVGEGTKQSVRDIVFRELDRVRVKGKETSLSIYEPVGLANTLAPETKAEIVAFHKAIALYRKRRWSEAQKLFRNLQQRDPERLIYDIYLSRIRHFLTNPPPPQWDGVFVHLKK